MKDPSFIWRVWCCAAVLLVMTGVSGCQSNYQINLKPVVTGIDPPEVRAIRVAIIHGETLQGPFNKQRPYDTITINMSEALRSASEAAYSTVFSEVTFVEKEADANKFDLVIHQDISHLAFFEPPENWGEITLALSLMSKGKSVWSGTFVSPRTQYDGSIVWKSEYAEWIETSLTPALVHVVKASARAFYEEGKLANIVRSFDTRFIEKQREIAATLKRKNAMFRVIANNADVHHQPATDSFAVDTYPMGSVIHVIGTLPSGWMQIARDGKPFGWLHRSTVEPETGGSGGATEIGKTETKPSIFIGYPKGGEDIADPEVSLLGYVTSSNLTKKVKVIVNGFSLDLDDLWNSSAIDTVDLRGFPLDLKVPLQVGDNQIEIQVTDKAGFLERNIVSVNRIDIKETQSASVTGLPARLADVAVAQRSGDVSAENFMAVLGNWVKDTAKSDYNKGNTMLDAGRFARAAYYYRKAIRTDPIGEAWFNLGISDKALGNEVKANKAFSTACILEIPQACDAASRGKPNSG